MAPKDIQFLIPKTCKYVTLYGKRDCVAVIKLRFLKWEDYPGLSGYAQCHRRVLIRGRQENQSQKEIFEEE